MGFSIRESFFEMQSGDLIAMENLGLSNEVRALIFSNAHDW